MSGKNKPQIKSPGGFRVFDITMLPPNIGQKVELSSLVVTGEQALAPPTQGDPYTACGGGIRSLGATLYLNYIEVTNNRANGDGGGVFAVSDGRKVLLRGKTSVVAANTAGESGGGIATRNCQLVIDEGAQVRSNTAGNNGGGIAVFASNFALAAGGAPVVLSIDGSFDEDSTVRIQGNKASSGDGGGVFVQNVAGALPTAQMRSATITDNRADVPVGGQTTGRGGGVAALGALTLNGDETVSVTGNFQRTNVGTLGVYYGPGVVGTFATDADVSNNYLIQ